MTIIKPMIIMSLMAAMFWPVQFSAQRYTGSDHQLLRRHSIN